MSEIFNSSFIPKKDFKKKEKKRGGKISIFFLISLIIFLSSIVASSGVYLWKISLNKQAADLSIVFKKKAEDFNLEEIQKLSELSRRVKGASIILENHHDVLPIFEFLEKNTLTGIQLTKLSLEEKDNNIVVNSKGKAKSLIDIQIQSENYGQNERINNLILSNLTKDRKGNWFFDIYFVIDKKYLTKSKLFNN